MMILEAVDTLLTAGGKLARFGIQRCGAHNQKFMHICGDERWEAVLTELEKHIIYA